MILKIHTFLCWHIFQTRYKLKSTTSGEEQERLPSAPQIEGNCNLNGKSYHFLIYWGMYFYCYRVKTLWVGQSLAPTQWHSYFHFSLRLPSWRIYNYFFWQIRESKTCNVSDTNKLPFRVWVLALNYFREITIEKLRIWTVLYNFIVLN